MIALRELHRDFAAEVTGVDMREPPGDALLRALEDAIARYPVLVLRNQDVTDGQHIAFVQPFGDLQQSTEYRTQKGEGRLPGLVTDASNLGKDNQTFGACDARRMNNLGSRRWHTDGSFNARPVKYSLLAARSVVRNGGETQFADMRNAYDGLPAGRRSLYLSSHASHVVGRPLPEGLDLLYELTDRATQPQFVYTHTWRLYDVVMWDNRVTMHRARRHTPETDPRDMRRVSVLDDANPLEQTA